jgi:class 3 adenylate cyclase/tetratricopeptide (TPR) repeat protein
MTCPTCGTENESGRKFCGECGAKLALACQACGTPNAPGTKFCGECGARLGDGAAPSPGPTPVQRDVPDAERRLVSVLFADLVGFTALSESRDPEEVRELLSRYFDTARRVIGRYGGVVEKFIGDAVMAVWGAPVAQEDDAERAVRAALDLVTEVGALGSDAGAPDLRLRAGVVAGEAAVTIGAEGQGMVAGDLVNTASRVQSAAQPGTVLVGDTTRRMTEASIAYEDAGEHELKGKAEPVRLWQALRVVAGRGGGGKTSLLEAPFVGRSAELRLVKELFHATADEGRAHAVSVVGIAGIGKSRLAWEFEKYTDGLVEEIWWHRGRCLPYGEGVAYWALAEMVRMRAGILEDEEPASALAKLRTCLESHLPDRDERAWVEPRLAHLLGLADRIAPDQQDLFSAWRRFFERMAEVAPVVLLFEDLHWADAALLDFVEYVLEWSRSFPIFVLTLARPELLDRRPTWGAGKRSFHSLFLEPLAEEARDELLLGLVPGLPEELRAQIRDRAEGVPLYAVETVRMLLDRGLLVRADEGYRLTGLVEALEVPETLHALIAARLDGLDPAERRLLEDGSVLGKTFTAEGLAAVSGLEVDDLEPLLASLVRKEILTVETDPRSPERGQYGFLHALVQRIAYDTLSKRERKARHLAVAAYLERAWGVDEAEIVEVVAAHYLEAYRAAPDADDAATIKSAACAHLARAADRAASLAANEEAERCYEQAAELAGQPTTEAELLERAGEAARAGGRIEAAGSYFERAIGLFERAGDTHPAARVSAHLGNILHDLARSDDAVERMEQAFAVLAADEPDGDLAALAHQLARLYLFRGEEKLALERVELALDVAESLRLPEVISQSLNTKALMLERRPHESLALIHEALRIALEHDLTAAALRAYNNLTVLAQIQDRFDEYMRAASEGLTLARRRGDRGWEWILLSASVEYMLVAGRWDEAVALAEDMPDEARTLGFTYFPSEYLVRLHSERGELDEARSLMTLLAGQLESSDLQARGLAAFAAAALRRAEGSHEEAREAAELAYACCQGALSPQYIPDAGAEICDASFLLGDLERVDELLLEWSLLRPAARTGSLEAHEARIVARLASLRGESDHVEPRLRAAAAGFRGLGIPFWLARTLLEHGEWLVAESRPADAEPLLSEARELFADLKARPWLERLDRVTTGAEAVA